MCADMKELQNMLNETTLRKVKIQYSTICFKKTQSKIQPTQPNNQICFVSIKPLNS